MAERRLAAIDLGAQSGRVATGTFDGERVHLDVAHRFTNRPLWLPDGLHWNLPQLFVDTLSGLAAASGDGRLDGIGIDSWGCDYALLDAESRMLGLPYHYRDVVRSSPDVVDRVFSRVPRHELYARTGIQTMPINTVFQLSTEPERVAQAARIALVPDLFGLWLSGSLVNELTAASTTGLLQARGLSWVSDLIGRLGLAPRAFEADVVPPGVDLGPVLAGHSSAGAAVGAMVRTVAGHDTASAFAAVPGRSARDAVLSSGTWSLLGVHVDEPLLGADAESFNLTNERGLGTSVRLLRNVMGMWLVEECRREWAADAGYDRLYGDAAAISVPVPLFDPDDDSLLHPGPMAERIAALCRRVSGRAPDGRAELIRSILTSLACKYRLVLERLESVTGERVEVVQVVGGAVRNELLCRLSADITRRPVLAGSAEATLLGNVLVQLLALGELASTGEMRELAGRSAPPVRYEPEDSADGDGIYGRFLDATGLAAPTLRSVTSTREERDDPIRQGL
jgi:rhamnulokinase